MLADTLLILLGLVVGFILTGMAFVRYYVNILEPMQASISEIRYELRRIHTNLEYIEHGHGPSEVHHEVRHATDEEAAELERTLDDTLRSVERHLNTSFRNAGLGSLGGMGLGSFMSPRHSWSYISRAVTTEPPPRDPSVEQPAPPATSRRRRGNNNSNNDLDLEL